MVLLPATTPLVVRSKQMKPRLQIATDPMQTVFSGIHPRSGRTAGHHRALVPGTITDDVVGAVPYVCEPNALAG